MILIGIDTGVITGLGVIIGQDKQAVSMPIHKAMAFVESLVDEDPVHIRVEDARKRKWFGNNSSAKKQGAGSVKRDAKIWEDFLTDLQKESNDLLTFEMIHPIKGATKLNQQLFKQMTGITTRTNEHARDAFMMVMNYKKTNIN